MKKIESPKRKSLQELADELQVFISYSVIEEQRSEALDLVKGFANNEIVLLVLRDFYAQLPEFREEAVTNVVKIVSRMGCYLFQVNTKTCEYLYLYNGEQAVFVGEKKDGIEDSDVLNFFGYTTNEDFQKGLNAETEDGDDDDEPREKVFCPGCSCAEGEFHELGCPVEVCPWCDGQLTYCNCRFEKLGVDEIVSEDQIDRFEMILNERGRIRFSADQAPSYPEDRDVKK